MSEDDAITAGLVDAAHEAVEHPGGDSPKDHGDPLAEVVPTEPAAREPETYSTAEAARLLGMSEERVRQMVDEGQLPGERDEAGVLAIPQQAVNEVLARRRKEPPHQ